MRAFTLIELLLYMALFALFASALATSVWQLEDASASAGERATALEERLLEQARSNRLIHDEP